MAGGEFVLEVGTETAKLILKDGKLISNLRSGGKKVKAAARATAHRQAPVVENYMRNNAPWTDRTGNARNGLAARPYEEGDSIGIVLYHQVPYGIWLETRWEGRYAIINPSIEAMGPRVMRSFERLLDRM